MKRYEKLTEEITGSILSGLLQAGDRLPSVRQTSASRGVSRRRCSRPTTCWRRAA